MTRMKSIKILVPFSTPPENVSILTLLFNRLIPLLKEQVDVKILRLVYQPDRISLSKNDDPNMVILDMHDYKNAVDVIQKEKPDLIYANPDVGFIDFAFSRVGRHFNIPVVNLIFHEPLEKIETTKIILSNFSRFFSNYVPTDVVKTKKSAFKRTKFILYKFFFMVKSLQASGVGIFKTIHLSLLILKFSFFPLKHLDPRFAITMHFLLNENTYKDMMDHGFDPNSLVVVGNPMFDDVFKKTSTRIKPQHNQTVRVLLMPDPFYEHGEWSKDQRDFTLTEIVKKITSNKDKFSLKVKIHPSAAVIDDYKKLVQLVDPTIPVYQTGSVEQYLDDADVVITYSSLSTAVQYALFANKPIVICNFFNRKDPVWSLGELGLAKECTNPANLSVVIDESLKEDPDYDQKRQNYITKYLYRDDGMAGKRMTDAILQLIK